MEAAGKKDAASLGTGTGTSEPAAPSGFYFATVKAVDGDYVSVEVPRLSGVGLVPRVPFLGGIASVNDQVYVSFVEGRVDYLVAFPVSVDADDIDDSSTTHKFVTAADLTNLSNLSGVNTGDQDLSAYQLKPAEGAFVDGDKTKLDGIEDLADVTDAANVETAIEAITLTAVAGAAGDEVLIVDSTDGGLKSVLWENLPYTPPGGTDGQVQYNDSGALGGATNLYYDDVNSRVGIGTSSPASLLDVSGTSTFTGASTFTGTTTVNSVDVADLANMEDSSGVGRKISVTATQPTLPADGDVWLDIS